MKRALLSLFFLQTFLLGAQSDYSDEKYYLIDSLEHIALSAEDSLQLQSFLQAYHQSTADTLRLALISDFIDNCWNDALWPPYNNWMLSKVNQALAFADGDSLYQRKLLYFKGTAWGNRAYQADIIGNYAEAEANYQKALGFFEQAHRVDGMGMVINALALIYENQADLSRAIELYNTALKIADQYDDHEFQAMSLLNIGRLQRNFDQYEKAQESFKLAEEAAILDQNPRLEGSALVSQATVYYFQYELDSALALGRRGLNLIKASRAELDLGSAYDLFARIYFYQNQLDSAEHYAHLLLENSQLSLSYEKLAIAYSVLGDVAKSKGDLAKAEQLALKAYQIDEAIGNVDQLKGDAQDLAQIYALLGDYKKSNAYLSEYVSLKDSLDHSDFQQQLLRQTAQYEFDKQKVIDDAKHQQELAVAEKEKERQGIIIKAILAISLVILIALIYSFSRQRIIRKQKEELAVAYENLEQQKEYEVLASNLKALQSQMNPHFIFNALNSIQTLVLKGETTSSYTYINRFASLIRKTLDFSEQKLVSLSEELKLLEDYLALEKLRFRDDFDYRLEADGLPELEIPPMLLQPLIENSLRHGLLHKEGKRELLIAFTLEAKSLHCLIRDNGIGRAASREINQRQRGEHKSFATGALQKRFNYLSKDYGDQIGFEYIDLIENGEARGTEVRVKLPYRLLADHLPKGSSEAVNEASSEAVSKAVNQASSEAWER